MNAPLHPQWLGPQPDTPQTELPLATEGVQRFVWQSRFGAMLIEVVGDVAFVSGERVDPAGAETPTSA